MNILLINPRGGREKAYPLGLAVISSALQSAGYRVTGCDMSFDQQRLPAIISSTMPAVIGITATCDTIGEVPEIITEVNQHIHRHRPVFVVGGPGVTTGNKSVLESLLSITDMFLVQGYGEKTIVDLMHHIQGRSLLPHNVMTRDNKGQRTHCSPVVLSPDYKLFPLARYSNQGTLSVGYPYAPLVTSRGCSHNCAFCAAPALSRSIWQPRTPAQVMRDIETTAATCGIHDFHIEDDDFVHDPDRLDELCDRIRSLSQPVVIECMNGIRPDELTTRVIHALARGRCRTLTVGVETTVPYLLGQLSRSYDAQHIQQLVQEIRSHGITAGGYYMLALPGETPDMTRETVAHALQSGFDLIKLSLFRPIPGSAWEDRQPDPLTYRTARRLRRRSYITAYLRPRALRAVYGRVRLKLVNLVLTRIVDALGGPS